MRIHTKILRKQLSKIVIKVRKFIDKPGKVGAVREEYTGVSFALKFFSVLVRKSTDFYVFVPQDLFLVLE